MVGGRARAGQGAGGSRELREYVDNSRAYVNNPDMATATRSRSITSIDELLTYAVGQVTDAGEECTFERLVYECFQLFPEQFRMQRYPDWPDSVRINKTWLRCRTDRGWIIGSVQEGFRLTERGRRVAVKVARTLGKGEAPLPQPSEGGRARERYEAMLKYVRRQPTFQTYQVSPDSFSLTNGELRVLLNGTLETPRRVLRQNLRAYQDAAQVYGDQEVSVFLNLCEAMMKEGSLVGV